MTISITVFNSQPSPLSIPALDTNFANLKAFCDLFTNPIYDRTQPGAIGGTTPGAASFTTVNTTGDLTVATNKFGVTASSGAMTCAGSFVCGGNQTPVLNGQATVQFTGSTNNGVVLDAVASDGLGFAVFSLSGTSIGSITRNASTSAVLYNTTSDYRIKTVFGGYTYALDTLAQIPVHEGVYIGDDKHQPLLLAHEVQAVMPWAVTGEKDAVDEAGNPVYQQMNYTAFVPLLIAAVKEQDKQIAALRAEVAALSASKRKAKAP